MMERKLIEFFLEKNVNVGIPHKYEEDRLFFYTGYLLKITDNYLIIKLKNGIKQIQLSDIVEITENKED